MVNDCGFQDLPRENQAKGRAVPWNQSPAGAMVSGTSVENDKTRVGHTEIQIPQLMHVLLDMSKAWPLRAKDLTGTPTSQNRSHIPQAIQRSFRLAIPNVGIDFGLARWKRFMRPTAGHQYRHHILPPKNG